MGESTKLVLVAIGGNSLIRAGQTGTAAEQRENAAITARYLVQLLHHDYRLVLTHGNGPQVGAQLLREEIAAQEVQPEPLDVCVAETQGSIGYALAHALHDALAEADLRFPVASLLTQVLVDEADSAFTRPTKPVGPFMSGQDARRREREQGWHVAEDAARGWRRVVPSPEPLEIVEIESIRSLVEAGTIVIAAGGGGIPVARRDGRLVGVEAVIDKDLASALLAHLLEVDMLVISTGVDHVLLNYSRPGQRSLDHATPGELRRYAAEGHFPAGSMGPKVEAAIRFVEGNRGRQAAITSPEHILDAVLGKAGTRIRAC